MYKKPYLSLIVLISFMSTALADNTNVEYPMSIHIDKQDDRVISSSKSNYDFLENLINVTATKSGEVLSPIGIEFDIVPVSKSDQILSPMGIGGSSAISHLETIHPSTDNSRCEVIGEGEFTYDWYCSGSPGTSPLTLCADGTCDIGGYSGTWAADLGQVDLAAGLCPAWSADVGLYFTFDNYETNYYYELNDDGTGQGKHDDVAYNGVTADGDTILFGDFEFGCPDGYVDDCAADGDCCPESWIGDGLCDGEDQQWGCDLSCYDNDGGDCDPEDEECMVVSEHEFTYDWYCSDSPGVSTLTLCEGGTCLISGGYSGTWGSNAGMINLGEGLCPAASLDVDIWFTFDNYDTYYYYEIISESIAAGWHDDVAYNGSSVDGQTTLSGDFDIGCSDGYVDDCADDGDCCPESWIGDGLCDGEDQAWGCDLSCYNNDGGDCEPDDGECVVVAEHEFTYDWYCSGSPGSSPLTLCADGTCDIGGYLGTWGENLGTLNLTEGLCPAQQFDGDLWFSFDNYDTYYYYELNSDETAGNGWHDDQGYNGQNVDGESLLNGGFDDGGGGNEDTIHVGPGQDYENIQDAIDDIIEGGEIIVHNGTYSETLLIEKDIYLHSLNGPSVTILNSNGAGSTIIMRPESENPHIPQVVIEGFTITNGSGTSMDVYYEEPEPVTISEKLGGGVLVYNVSPSITNCTLNYNGFTRAQVRKGGGLFATGTSEDITFPTRDYICVAPPVSEPMNLSNNIFLVNHADEGVSVYIQNFDDLTTDMSDGLYDVFNDSDELRNHQGLSTYWAYLENSDYDATNSEGQHEAIEHDVWVDPVNGNDMSNGDENQPFKTIDRALSMIYPSEDNPITIHLKPGVHSPEIGNYFPIHLYDYTSISGEDQNNTIIDAMESGRVIDIKYSVDVMLSNLTLTNGSVDDGCYCPDHTGAGVHIYQTDSILDHVSITNSFGVEGSGLYIGGGSVLINNCSITNGTAKNGGAGIQGYYADLTINNSIISDNHVDISLGDDNGMHGAGLHLYHCSLYLTDVIVARNINDGSWGGGMRASYCDVVINGGEFTENSSNSTGGGILLDNTSTLEISDLLMRGNSSTYGSAITAYENTYVRIQNATITENPNNQGAISASSDDFKMTNSIVYNNGNYSIWSNSFTGEINYCDVDNFDFSPDSEGNINSAPLFVDTENGNYTLQYNSPCIDAGTADIDDDGIDDISDYYGSAPDMGAFEFEGENETPSGDLNGDGQLNILDVVLLVNLVLYSDYNEDADLNEDGQLNVLDIVILVNLVLNS